MICISKRCLVCTLSYWLLIAIPTQAQDWQGYYQAGRQAHQQQDYQAAIAAYSQALALAPNEIKLYRLRAEAWQYLGYFKEAHQDIQTALALAPDKPALYEALGWLAIYEHDFPAARQALRQALRLDPEYHWARLNLGHAYLLDPQQPQAYALAIMTWRPMRGTPLGKLTFAQALSKDLKRLGLLFPDTASQALLDAAGTWLQHTE